MLRKLFLSIFTFLFAWLVSFGQKQDKVQQAVESATYYEISFKKIPGLAIGLHFEDSTYFFEYGELGKGSDLSPNRNTVYEISSVTKVFTSTLFALLEEEGALSMEDPISDYLEVEEFSFGEKPVLIKHLLNHTSGLPKQPFNFGSREKDPRNPYAYYSAEDLNRFLARFRPLKEPGSEYLYSHVGYAILELIAEQATGKAYTELLSSYILGPLDMESTSVDLNESMLSRFAQGYSISGDETNPWSFNTYTASLGLKSTTKDLMKFARACLDEGSLIGKALPKLLEEQVKTEIETVSVAEGWHLMSTRKNFPSLVLHSGVSDGHRSYLALIPEKNCAITVLSNSEHPTNGVGGYILQYLFNNFKERSKKLSN